jgi:putative SOS response-associated peptidase YedK
MVSSSAPDGRLIGMCGRYAASRNADSLALEFEAIDATNGGVPADYNVAPTKPVLAVLERAHGDEPPKRQLRVLRWGLVPSWAKDPSIGGRLVNARLETAAEKPAFRKAFARRRCLLPADGYYEWYSKQPYFIHPTDGAVLAMAGLYEFWRDPSRDREDPEAWLTTMTVLTTTATDDLGRIHDRAPLLVEPHDWARWLDPRVTDVSSLSDLLIPAAPGRLAAYPVSTLVNNVRNNGPELLDAATE